MSAITKLLERLVASQLMTYIDRAVNRLRPTIQSGFRRGYYTETMDLLDVADRDDAAVLVFLDLSVEFGTVDHEILLERLRIASNLVT